VFFLENDTRRSGVSRLPGGRNWLPDCGRFMAEKRLPENYCNPLKLNEINN
jgi:hypothetical protein